MRRILILTAGFGDGHNTAARSLREALEKQGTPARAEVVDLLQYSYGLANQLARRAYHGLIQHAPTIWAGLFHATDWLSRWSDAGPLLARAKGQLAELINDARPDVVLTTYPVYGSLVQALYPDPRHRPFRFGVIVTDSLTVHTSWYAAPADFFCVPNEETAEVLRQAGLSAERIHALGFPVSPRFGGSGPADGDWEWGRVFRVLYVLNHGTRKAAKTLRCLLRLEGVHLTVVTGRSHRLRQRLQRLAAGREEQVEVLGWTDQMPELMKRAHLVVTKAGGATVQEALAAGKPVVLTQVVPGQEEGNARWVTSLGLGGVASRPRKLARLVGTLLKHRGNLYRRWRRRVEGHCRPHAANQCAQLVLQHCARAWVRPPDQARLSHPSRCDGHPAGSRRLRRRATRAIWCDFHAHSTYSDGRLSLPEVVEFYGRRRFDVLCLTDHVADPGCWIGRMGERLGLTLSPANIGEYFELLERERRRAWNRYGMLLLTGLEFNKERFTANHSAHLLGIGLQAPIDPTLSLPEIIGQIHTQGGLAVAPHPHKFGSVLAKNTLLLWQRRSHFIPLIDAWEIANRNHIFAAVGLEGLPFIAGSDFHRPSHIRSWKTLLFCEKHPQAIAECIRANRHLALAYYDGKDPVPAREVPCRSATPDSPEAPGQTLRPAILLR